MRRIIFLFLLMGLFPGRVWASVEISINPQDRILILAPHPDDEAIGTGGVIQRAVQLGVPVKVVYLTNGENNELAFLVYKKHPVLGTAGVLKMGDIRRKESVEAMKFLGLQESQLVFLGYPDYGTSEIFTKYWGEDGPYKSMLARVSQVPYKDAFSYGALFKGESVIGDLKKILLDFRPTKIFVTLPADTNADHRAFYLFLHVTLWELKGQIAPPQVFCYVVHVIRWPVPRGFYQGLSLDVPLRLTNAGLHWFVFDLSPQEVARKKKAMEFYKSQNAYNHSYLFSFARKNELFGQFDDIELKGINGAIAWEEHIARQKIFGHLFGEESRYRSIIQSATYVQRDGKLIIRLVVHRWESKVSGINLFLIGYKDGVDFYRMPKIRININFDRFVTIFDRLQRVKVDGMVFLHSRNVLLIEFPLAALGDPDRIFTSAKSYIARLPLEATPWRLLKVDREVIQVKE